ncbi:hypothetical protein RIF29_28881 [Crotalaria pallida]|uniref:Uncharacterized protein n=1 Tax=Crotalaria pallida TaxID=3830 RepID=A0AAN9EDR8_CROPI
MLSRQPSIHVELLNLEAANHFSPILRRFSVSQNYTKVNKLIVDETTRVSDYLRTPRPSFDDIGDPFLHGPTGKAFVFICSLSVLDSSLSVPSIFGAKVCDSKSVRLSRSLSLFTVLNKRFTRLSKTYQMLCFHFLHSFLLLLFFKPP